MIVDPATTLNGVALLRQHAGAPVALALPVRDVPALAEAVRAEALDIWIADPLDLGGPAALVRALGVCRAFGIDVALDARCRGEVGAALALHLAASHRVVNRAVEISPALCEGNVMLAAGLRIEHGHGVVPDGPGLGVVPDPAIVQACRVEHVALTGRSDTGA
jgi:L-alanine-DL-glutamate epimerase-like enolase superfamily enzyme